MVFGVWILTGCSSSQGDDDALLEPTPPADELYEGGIEKVKNGKYKLAIEDFEKIEQEYPASDYAKRAQIMSGFSAYKKGSYDEAAMTLARFVKLHPSNEQAPYAYYLRALCFYDQIVDVSRDQEVTQKARQALREVVSRFPDSDYARDASIKLELTEDHLAGKEMEIGRYYLTREEFLAAIGRFSYVIEHYQTTSHTPEALHRLVEAYLQLGVRPEAEKYAAVLGHNYPGSKWYQYSYAMMHGQLDPKAAKTSDESWFEGFVPDL